MHLQELIDYLDSDAGKQRLSEFISKEKAVQSVADRQMQRLRDSGRFADLAEKALLKYDAEEYRGRWYGRGIEPPEDLLWFLMRYAAVYGRECNEAEWDRHANQFTSSLLFCDGYYFNRMDGQGCAIHVTKQD